MGVLRYNNKSFIFLSIALLVLSLNILNPLSIQANEVKKDYSGKELFAGIAFGQGEVGELFPEVWSTFDQQELNSAESLQKTEEIMNEIDTIDSKFFDDFKNAIESKDVYEIEKLMERGYPLLEDSLKDVDNDDYLDEAIGKCAVLIFAVVGIAAVGVQHQWVYNHESVWTTSGKSLSENQIEREKYIANMIDRL